MATEGEIRNVYNIDDLKLHEQPTKKFRTILNYLRLSFGCQSFGTFIRTTIPIIDWLPKYKWKKQLPYDIVASLTLTLMLVSQGMADGMLSQMPAVMGLYTAIFPTAVYVLLGTSKHQSMGTYAAVALLTGSVIQKFSTDRNRSGWLDPYISQSGKNFTRRQVLEATSLVVGLFQMIGWILRLGIVTSLMSKSLLSGFTTGTVTHVLVAQVPIMLGITIYTQGDYFMNVLMVIEIALAVGQTNVAVLVMALVVLIILQFNESCIRPRLMKVMPFPFPMEMVVIVVSILLSDHHNYEDKYQAQVVGKLPTGFPSPSLPNHELLTLVAEDALVIMIISYSASISIALLLSDKGMYKINPDQEFLAMGVSNIFGSFLMCAPTCSAMSRSYLTFKQGGNSLLASASACVLLSCILLWMAPLMEPLPKVILAAIVTMAVKGALFEIRQFREFWLINRYDGFICVTCFLVTTFVSIHLGLMSGMLVSIACVFWRESHPYTCLLGAMGDTTFYGDIDNDTSIEASADLMIYQYCGSLSFASKHRYERLFYDKCGLREIYRERTSESEVNIPVKCVILDLKVMTYVDREGIEILRSIHQNLQDWSITLLIASGNSPVIDVILKYNAMHKKKVLTETFPTVHEAVRFYRAQGATVRDHVIEL